MLLITKDYFPLYTLCAFQEVLRSTGDPSIISVLWHTSQRDSADLWGRLSDSSAVEARGNLSAQKRRNANFGRPGLFRPSLGWLETIQRTPDLSRGLGSDPRPCACHEDDERHLGHLSARERSPKSRLADTRRRARPLRGSTRTRGLDLQHRLGVPCAEVSP